MLVKDKKSVLVFLCAILTPVVGCIFILLRYGASINDISIFSSKWNDELFYYKQITAVLKYGCPQGYFGFNGSHSLLGNFAAWSPTTILLYVFIGKIFGWNQFTPIVINCVVWMISFGVFALVLRPNNVQMISVSVMWIAFEVGIRYIFSVTPESFITVLLLLGVIFYLKYINDNSKKWLLLADFFLLCLTCMRSYYATFGLLLISVEFIKSKKRITKAVLFQIGITLLSMIVSVLLTHYFTASYFEPIIDTNWMTDPSLFIYKLKKGFIKTTQYINQAIESKSSMRGSWYILYFFLVIYTLYSSVKKKSLLLMVAFVTEVTIILAMYLFYNAAEGSRHVMAITHVGLILITYEQTKNKFIYSVLPVFFTTFFMWLSSDMWYTTLPLVDKEEVGIISSASKILDDNIIIGDDPWNNTILVSLSCNHNDIYAIPDGMGLNYCYSNYLLDNFDSIKASYIATNIGDELDCYLLDEKCPLVYSYGHTNIYKVK